MTPDVYEPGSTGLNSLTGVCACAFALESRLLPLEPLNYPQHDPGPYTLLTTLSEQENLARMESVMASAQGYVGLVGEFGSRFTTRSTTMLPVLEQVKRRGLKSGEKRYCTVFLSL